MKRLSGVVLAVVGAALLIWAWRAPPDGSARSLVIDEARLMTEQERASVARYHRHLLNAYDIDYRVVTARSLADIDQTAVETFRELGETSFSRSGRGLLLLIDASSDRVRLEVGYPLEGTFPDAFVDYVERRQMVPFFERGRVSDGIVATTELIVSRAQRGADGLDTASEPWTASSGGAGATTAARLGAGSSHEVSGGSDVSPASTPEGTVSVYFRAMADHNADARLSIYTPSTRAMLEGRTMTPAQMDNLVSTYRRCPSPRTRTARDGDRAVIRYPAAARECAPFFLERLHEGWQLDLTMMQRVIRFDSANRWHFEAGVPHRYDFGFEDWRLDARGYPSEVEAR